MVGYEIPEDDGNTYDRAVMKVERLEARVKVLEVALKDIARQNLESEIHEDYREDADYRGAYDCIIRVARAALEVK
jgi:NADH:ubiquinone oxidoreductase subunit D